METMTPEQLFWILGMGVTVTIVSTLYHERARWLPWVLAAWDRYVIIDYPRTPEALRGRRTTPAPSAPRTTGAPGAHAENDGAPGARTAPAPAIGDAALGDLLPLIQRIAGHKLRMPDDGKTATGQALGIAKSGSSAKWQSFSRAWDLLYPPPAVNILRADNPEAWDHDERGNLRRIQAVTAK